MAASFDPALDDPAHNITFALEAWVEKGTAPEKIVASGVRGDDRTKSITRPLCPYPQVAHYKGTGDTNDAANFACAAPLNPR